ncbi:MAG: hypothetical protein M3237_24185 [Actinomycetota bacterium]|nr:hypothetical protein [Actinomycetota bacterium]
MRNLKRNAAVIAATAVIGSVGIGGVMAAQADTTPKAPAGSSVQSVPAGAEETADGPDQGADADPNEPGHQDADESGEAEGVEGAAETADGPDQGADATPDVPGHQDADESGEAN